MRNATVIQRARILRRGQTDAERALWRLLRSRQFANYKFRRQHPIESFVADFACLERMVVIEVDGAHHADQRQRDHRREQILRAQGFRILRFSDRQVLTELDSVAEAVLQALQE